MSDRPTPEYDQEQAPVLAKTAARWTGWTGRLPLTLTIGVSMVAVFVVMALISVVYVPFATDQIDIAGRLQPPSLLHWLGTDHLGRDVLSMIMEGTQTSMLVAFGAVAIGAGLGVPLGLLASAKPGPVDDMVMRGNDVIFAFPAIILAVLIAALLGPGTANAIIAIGVFNIPVFAQTARGAARILWQQDFILSARTVGMSTLQISRIHILPNCLSLLAVQATIQFSLAIAAEAALSYIGLGAQPPTPSWGRMLNDAQTLFDWAPWLSVFPGLAIFLTVLALNLAGDGLRDLLDPRRSVRHDRP